MREKNVTVWEEEVEEGRESVVREAEGEVQESCASSEVCDDEPGQGGEEGEGWESDTQIV